MSANCKIWSIVQCDADRAHLSPINRLGVERIPIQYCCVADRVELARRAMHRAIRLSGPSRVMVTVADVHREHWLRTLWPVPENRRIVDSLSGRHLITLAAAAAAIESLEPTASIAVIPADAFCANDTVLCEGINAAANALEKLPQTLLALSLEPPRQGEPQDYLVMGAADGLPGRSASRCVRRPSAPVGRRLAAAGACINSGVYVFRVNTLTTMLEQRWPVLMKTLRIIVGSSAGEVMLPSRFEGSEFQRPWRHTWLQRPVRQMRALSVPRTDWSSLSSFAAIERLAIEYPDCIEIPPGPAPELLSAYVRLARLDSCHHLIPHFDSEPLSH